MANRVGEIRESTEPEQWKYVPTALNPADDCTRGLTATELNLQHRFLTGPAFLLESEETWPLYPGEIQPVGEGDPEIRWIGATQLRTGGPISVLTEKSSRCFKLLRIGAYVLRFIGFARKKIPHTTDPLTATEIHQAKMHIIRLAQLETFGDEFRDLNNGRSIESSSSIISLAPMLNEDGVICIGCRLENADIAWDSKHPIILPSTARITTLLIREFHEKFWHSSTERTFHELRKIYWIPRGRQFIKKIVKRCVWCKRVEGRIEQPVMAALPYFRTAPDHAPFYYCGVDYFGPIEVMVFRRRVKRWGCLFTCMVTRAVHLEVAHSMSTDSFLTALANFESRLGVPNS